MRSILPPLPSGVSYARFLEVCDSAVERDSKGRPLVKGLYPIL